MYILRTCTIVIWYWNYDSFGQREILGRAKINHSSVSNQATEFRKKLALPEKLYSGKSTSIEVFKKKSQNIYNLM